MIEKKNMKLGVQLILIVVCSGFVANSVNAQTLGQQLLAEDPMELANEAREAGDIVRGAILYHQGNLNCAKCHRTTNADKPIGPDLSKMEAELDDAYIIESILLPSKKIKKGFESMAVLQLDGKLVTGTLVEENAAKIVLRDTQNVDRLITVLKDDIDDVSTSKKSSMPDDLANQLKDRQQFLDLLRYVIDIRERGPQQSDAGTDQPQKRELSPELEGLIAIGNRNCTACHQAKSSPANTLAALLDNQQDSKKAPNLNWSGKWLNPDYLVKFIADPSGVKPGTTMPHMLGQLSEPERRKAATAITQYLIASSGNQFRYQPVDVEAASRGHELFHSVGCVACHSPRNQAGAEMPLDASVALGELSEKHSLQGLIGFLKNPHVARPSGRMPSLLLSHHEAVDISHFLLQDVDPKHTPFKTDAPLVETGKALFASLNCASCHGALEANKLQNSKLKPASQVALDELRPDHGCLSSEKGVWPEFNFSDNEPAVIAAALKRLADTLTSEDQIRVTLKTFNCIACHQRGDFGGVPPERGHHFQTINLNLGEQGRIPPGLTDVGAKLKSAWLRDVMVKGRSIRPYMKTRMPQFGEKNIGHLIGLFESTDKLPETKYATFDDQKETREYGLTLAGGKGLNCVACHTYKYKQADTMPAVDLTEMAERLKKDWFYQYMLNPQKFSPNTVMPSFWPGGKAIRSDLKGDPEFQVEALWQYLIDGRQARMPAGVVREKLEIVVTDQAQMLRRSYSGIGKRGIGVGYPGGVNLAFDAEQLRLAMIWKGKFVDPGGVWTGQGSGVVRPMTEPITLAKGPELDGSKNPWVVDDGRPPNHHFQGYFLDQVRRPTFKYVFDKVQVEDFFSSQVDQQTEQAFLRRQISLTASEPHSELGFRIAVGKKILKLDSGLFSIEGQFKVRIDSKLTPVITGGELKQLQLPLNLTAGETENFVIDYFLD